MIKQIIAMTLSACALAIASIGSGPVVTHEDLTVHLNKESTAKYITVVDESHVFIELMGDYVEHNRFTTEEKEILCRIAEAEATDGTIQQKKNVMSCVMNRVISKDFPDTIESVVFQKGQFSPISDGRYYKVKIQDSTYEAFEEWLDDCDEGNVHDCLFFCMPTCKSAVSGWFSTKEVVFQDGMHNFYK